MDKITMKAVRWQALRFGGLRPVNDDAIRRLYAELDAAYSAPDRHYHDWRHIDECFQLLREYTDENHLVPSDIALVRFALLYHDAIYVPGAPENEERSARAARSALLILGAGEQIADAVARLIGATRHGVGISDSETVARTDDTLRGLIQDIDLAILGASPNRFLEYDRGIGKEYAAVTEATFREGRRTLIESFLNRPRLYITPFFHRRLHESARSNLRKWLERHPGS